MSISTALQATSLEESGTFDLRRAVRMILRLAGQLALFWSLLNVGSLLASKLALPLPGNLVGLLLLLGLMRAGVVQPAWVHDLAAILVRHLVFFFIPLAVGLMVWQDLLVSSGPIIGLSLIGSASVGLVVAGLTAQLLINRGGRSSAA